MKSNHVVLGSFDDNGKCSGPQMNEKIFRRLAEDSPFYIGICDTSFNVIFVNDAGRRMVGLETGADLGALRIEDFIYPDDRDEVLARFLSDVNHPHHGETDVRFRHFKTGEALWVMYTVFPLTGDNGDCLGYAVKTRDISLRRAAEASLRENEQRLRLALDAAGQGTWELDLHTNAVTIAPRVAEMFGVEDPQALTTLAQWHALVMDEDRSRIHAALETAVADDAPYRIEFRIVRPVDGRLCWVVSEGQIVRDADGLPARIIGVARDITRRKKADEARRLAEERYRAIVESQAELICRFALDGTILFVNTSYARALGTTPDALEGANLWNFVTEEDRPFVQGMLDQISPASPEACIENRFETAEGTRWVLWTNRGLVFDDQGHPLELQSTGIDITDRKRAEAALARSEAEFRSLFELSAAGAAQSDPRTGRLLRVNERFCEITGYSSDELLARTYRDLTHPDDLAADEDRLNAVLRGERDRWESEKRYVRADGTSVWVHVVGRLVCDDANQPYCTIANILDITDRKRIEDALRDSEQRFKTMADTAPSMLWVTDENLNCTFLSRGWFDYTGQTEAEGYGTGWTQAVHPDDRPDAYEAFVAAASRREPFSVDYRLRRYDGTYRWAIDAGRPRLSEAGDLIGYIGSVTDAHQRKEAEEALQRANDELEVRVQDRTKELQRRAMQLSRLTSELTLTEQRERRRIAQVLHDHLQQLLVAASLRLGVLGRSASDRQKQSVEELSELLEEAIRASRSLTVELAPPILHEAGLSAGLKWLARWMQEKHGLVVHVQTDEEATGEPEDVRILLFHSVRELLFNVVKHAGSPIATVDLRIVKKRYLQVTVADQGEGFDPLRIFSEEQRSASGFGLFSIRERLSMLGGRLEIANDPEGGSVITMMAPIQPVHSAAPQKLDRSGAAGRAGERVARRRRQTDSARIRILLVDDHEVMRQGVRAILMDEPDMEVAGEASNGVEAIEQAHLIQPDVVLMDFSMPEMNGLEATRRIAAELPHVKIIGLSMYEEHEQAAAMLNAGASDYRTKSGNMEQLLDTIRNVYQAAEGKPSGQ